MKFCISPEGNQVAYQTHGKNSPNPLVLLHGFCEDHRIWVPILPLLEDQFLILVDLPGFGASEMPGKPQMEAYALAVHAVLEAENIERCTLLGHSMGGYVALAFAAHWPNRLNGISLLHAHPYPDSTERIEVRKRGIETVLAGKKDLYVAQLFSNLCTPEFAAAHPEALNTLIVNGKEQSAQGIASALEAMMNRRDHQETLSNLRIPVQFILGEHDALVLLEATLPAVLLPDIGDLHILAGVAHLGMLEDAGGVARGMRAILSMGF